MQFKTFCVRAGDKDIAEDELNAFLRGHRILRVEHHFSFENGGVWFFLVEYAEQGHADNVRPQKRINQVKEVEELNEDARARFDLFKNVRLRLSRERNVPAYAIFTDKELAVIAQIDNLSTDSNIKGIAPSRLKNSIEEFVRAINDEKSGSANAVNS